MATWLQQEKANPTVREGHKHSLFCETPGQLQGSKTPKPENPRKKLKVYPPDPDPKLLEKNSKNTKITQKIRSLPLKNLGKSRGPPQSPAEPLQRPRRTLGEPSERPPQSPLRQISSESLAEGCAPRMVTLRNFRSQRGRKPPLLGPKIYVSKSAKTLFFKRFQENCW